MRSASRHAAASELAVAEKVAAAIRAVTREPESADHRWPPSARSARCGRLSTGAVTATATAAGRRRGGRGGDPRSGVVELELFQLGGHEDVVRAASGGNPADKGLGVEPIELLVVVERVVVEEEEALYLTSSTPPLKASTR